MPEENPQVDIFIPVAVKHVHVLPAAICSALTQTYPNKRILLFLDGLDQRLENVVTEWFYTSDDAPTAHEPYQTLEKLSHSKSLNHDAISVDQCERGVVIRNRAGPSGSAHAARQWLFEWPEKSEVVKMLDADDIITPHGLEIMMKYLEPDVDGVFCPLMRSSHYRFAAANPPDPQNKQTGSGSMLLRKKVMDAMIKEGYRWLEKPGHDRGFFEFIRDREEKFNFKVTTEDTIYLYLK